MSNPKQEDEHDVAIRKNPPSWTDVKTKLADFDRAGLLGLVQDLYAANKDNQNFLHARLNLGARFGAAFGEAACDNQQIGAHPGHRASSPALDAKASLFPRLRVTPPRRQVPIKAAHKARGGNPMSVSRRGLMANAAALLSTPPVIEKIDLLAAKLPG